MPSMRVESAGDPCIVVSCSADSSGIVSFDKAEVVLERTELVNVTVPVPSNATNNSNAQVPHKCRTRTLENLQRCAVQFSSAHVQSSAAQHSVNSGRLRQLGLLQRDRTAVSRDSLPRD